jgi:hypothetical protein
MKFLWKEDGEDVERIIIKWICKIHVVNNGHIDLMLISLKLKKIKKKQLKKLLLLHINLFLIIKIVVKS